MKVLIVGSGELDCAAANCGVALRSMGCEVRHFDPEHHPRFLARIRRSWQARFVMNSALTVLLGHSAALFSADLVRTARDWQPDLVLVIPITVVPAHVVAGIRRVCKAKIAGWFQDSFVNFGRHEFVLADYDGLFFKDPYIVERLREWGGMDHVHYLPEACEPARHRPLPLTDADIREYGCDLAFYGNLYPYRLQLMEGLWGLPRDLRLYGAKPAPWLCHPLLSRWQGREVYFDEKVKSVLAAKIVVNTSHFGEVRSINARTFEVAGIGGFQVADAPAIAEFFEPGREIVTFRGPKELRQVVEHYLERPDERQEIAARGRERAHREHTYAARLSVLLRVLGLTR